MIKLKKMARTMTSLDQEQLKRKEEVNEFLLLKLTQLTAHIF